MGVLTWLFSAFASHVDAEVFTKADVHVRTYSADDRPALVDPKLDGVGVADTYLEAEVRGIAVEEGGEAAFYPLPILASHGVVNTVLAGRGVAVVYLPFERSYAVYGRGESVFSLAGREVDGHEILTDETNASQIMALSGEWLVPKAHAPLERLPAYQTTWESWKTLHANGKVLSRSTGYDRDYGIDPYDVPGLAIPWISYRGERIGELPLAQRVTAFRLGNDVYTIAGSDLRRADVWQGRMEGASVVAWYNPQTEEIDVFSAQLPQKEPLTFLVKNGEVQDQLTGSVWRLDGVCVIGPLQGTKLTRLATIPTLWGLVLSVYPDSKRLIP